MNDAPVLPGLRPRVAGVGLNRAERVGLEKPYHVATIDHDKALIGRLTIGFIGPSPGADPAPGGARR
jgi:hypothetical protein